MVLKHVLRKYLYNSRCSISPFRLTVFTNQKARIPNLCKIGYAISYCDKRPWSNVIQISDEQRRPFRNLSIHSSGWITEERIDSNNNKHCSCVIDPWLGG